MSDAELDRSPEFTICPLCKKASIRRDQGGSLWCNQNCSWPRYIELDKTEVRRFNEK